MAAQQPDQGTSKGDYHILWIIVLIVFIGLVLWLMFSEQIMNGFLFIRYWELEAIYWVTQLWGGDLAVTSALERVSGLNAANLTLEDAEGISEIVGEYLRYLIVPLLLFFGINLYTRHLKTRFKRKHSMHTLASSEQDNWPQIQPVLSLDLVKEDIDSGPWAMAMTPIQFCKRYKLVNIEVIFNENSITQDPQFKVSLIPERAEKVFGAQLGRIYQGVEHMPPHRRALFAVFIARGCRDTDTARSLLTQLSNSAAKGKLDLTGVDALWKKHIKNIEVEKFCQRHAYEMTLMISALLFGRQDGVQATADFLWLKPMDRRLWYTLNNTGRQTPTAEAAGVFAHWLIEKALQRPLSIPMVNEATRALQLALTEMLYIPDEDEKKAILAQKEA